MNKKTDELLKKLCKQLKRQFPAYHWNHVNVWSKYWQLKEEIERG